MKSKEKFKGLTKFKRDSLLGGLRVGYPTSRNQPVEIILLQYAYMSIVILCRSIQLFRLSKTGVKKNRPVTNAHANTNAHAYN